MEKTVCTYTKCKKLVKNRINVNHAKVMSYYDLLTGKENIGDKVAILGAGGIGFDVADDLLHRADSNDSER